MHENKPPQAVDRVRIDPLSCTSLYLKLYVNGIQLSTATGFLVNRDERNFLISNWHVFSGRDANTGKPLSKTTAALPDEVRIAHHVKGKLGTWKFVGERLYNKDGSARWLEHPRGKDVDVAAIELSNTKSFCELFPLDLSLAETDVVTYPGMPVSIIGFPFGLRPHAFFPIWKTGHIASDPDLSYEGRPAFLIDATTREGMSGSPVVARLFGSHINSRNIQVVTGVITKFLGVYASRIRNDAEIGCVWRPSVINELLRRGLPPNEI